MTRRRSSLDGRPVRAIPVSNRRLIILALTAFFMVSAYLCSTRLFNMSFQRGAAELKKEPATSPAKPADEKPKEVKPLEIKLTAADAPMLYGQFGRPGMDDMTLMEKLPSQFIPTVENQRRLIVVGDIHGMNEELGKLLEDVGYTDATDHLVSVGDMVSKGPDSSGVVSRLMELGASAVRGNHEDRVLLARAEVDLQEGISAELSSASAEAHRGVADHLAVARSLTSEQIAWLSQRPVILSIDELSIYVVHAGLVPGVKVEKQDPWAIMNMRTLVYPKEDLRKKENKNGAPKAAEILAAAAASTAKILETVEEDEDMFIEKNKNPDRVVAVPVDGRGGENWSEAWDVFQARLKDPYRRSILYGHNSKQGYKEGEYTFGLDSGCVKGDSLTALVISADVEGGFSAEKRAVKCRKP